MHHTPQPFPAAEQPQRNHGLFSDHYLDVTLPRSAEWNELAEEARPVMEGVACTFGSYFPSENEQHTERDLVQPVLEVLGHTFEAQAPLESPGGTKRPDYVS